MALADVFGRDPLEVLLLGGLALVILAALARTVLQRRLLQGRSEDAEPLLVFPEESMRRPITPASIGGPLWESEENQGTAEHGDVGAVESEPAADTKADVASAAPSGPSLRPTPLRSAHPPIRPAPTPGWARRDQAPRPIDGSRWAAASVRRDPGDVDETSLTIRIPTADDGTVQLLPGRLVMTQGPDVGKEFRFLRVAGESVPQVTLGRISGPPYKHIQLPAATVSRMHARLHFENGGWHITNLSTTNPVRLNGREVTTVEEIRLSNGDRIQLGEVELSFVDGRS